MATLIEHINARIENATKYGDDLMRDRVYINLAILHAMANRRATKHENVRRNLSLRRKK